MREVIVNLATKLEVYVPKEHICDLVTLKLKDTIEPSFIESLLGEKYRFHWRR